MILYYIILYLNPPISDPNRTPPYPYPPLLLSGATPQPLTLPRWPLAPPALTTQPPPAPPTWTHPAVLHPSPDKQPYSTLYHPPLSSHSVLTAARKQSATQEILLLTTPSETRKALQTSKCNELLGLMTATYTTVAEL